MKKFHCIKQHDSMGCGIACLQMICAYYGKKFPKGYLIEDLELLINDWAQGGYST